MTRGGAALIGLTGRYLDGLLDPFVTLLEVHKLMYFMPGTRLSVVGVATRPTFRLVSTEATLPRPFGNAGGNQVRLYDMAPDGHIYGFLSSASASAATSDRFRVVLNWVDDLKRRVPVP